VSRPHDAVLGRVKGIKGFHDIADYPEATTIPGLILYRFDANLVFFNADYFRGRVREIIAAAEKPVEWFVLDASSVNVVDATAIQKIDEIREELTDRGIVFALSRVKPSLERHFEVNWVRKRHKLYGKYDFHTLKAAVRAFNNRAIQGPEQKPEPGISHD
jgi:MFS superfamily sulfate permease-like transporter